MARSIWTGSLGFGLVTIPVEVHSAVRDPGPEFHLLRERDRSRIRYRRIAEKDEQPVEWDDLVRGYEYRKGHWIVMTKADFEAAALERTRRIDILDFVRAAEIDDRYFDKPYYLVAGNGGDHAYALFREALRESGQVGVGKFVLRDKQHLVAIEAIHDAVVLTTMRFREELVATDELKFPEARGLRKKDLDLAKRLIEGFSAEWDPGKYTNEYRQNLMRIIEAKQKGKQARVELEEAEPTGRIVDLMEQLRRSIESSPAARSKSRRGQASAAGRSRKAAGSRRKSKRRADRRAA